MEYILIPIFALAFVSAIFLIVSRTVGKLRGVKNSPTLDDLLNQEMVAKRDLARHEYRRKAQDLPEQVRALADKGDVIGATKVYKDNAGASLKETKIIIETNLSFQKKES